MALVLPFTETDLMVAAGLLSYERGLEYLDQVFRRCQVAPEDCGIEEVYSQSIWKFVGTPRGFPGTSWSQKEEVILSWMKHALYELHICPQNGDYSAVLGRRMATSPPFCKRLTRILPCSLAAQAQCTVESVREAKAGGSHLQEK